MKIEELFSVRGKVALVTGSRGIGEMIARAYVETARKAEAFDALASEPSKIGECIPIPSDISRLEEIDRLGTEIERLAGWLRLDERQSFPRRRYSVLTQPNV